MCQNREKISGVMVSATKLQGYLLLFSTLAASDFTPQEIMFYDYSIGCTMVSCNSQHWTDETSEQFKSNCAQAVNNFCANHTNCGIQALPKGAAFLPENVIIMEGYPDYDYAILKLRFMVLYPAGTILIKKQLKPLLSRLILSSFIREHGKSFLHQLGWQLHTYEKYPKYDAITEFMNVAIIPLTLGIFLVMYILAYCVSNLSYGPDVILVVGTQTGKNVAQDRVKQIIQQQQTWDSQAVDVKEKEVQYKSFTRQSQLRPVQLNVEDLENTPPSPGENTLKYRSKSSPTPPQIIVSQPNHTMGPKRDKKFLHEVDLGDADSEMDESGSVQLQPAVTVAYPFSSTRHSMIADSNERYPESGLQQLMPQHKLSVSSITSDDPLQRRLSGQRRRKSELPSAGLLQQLMQSTSKRKARKGQAGTQPQGLGKTNIVMRMMPRQVSAEGKSSYSNL